MSNEDKQSLEQHVADLTHQLQCAKKEQESLIYSVSHDLRAPIRAIDGFTGFLEEDYGAALDDEGRRLLAVIRANTRKMEQMISGLLLLSRTLQGEMRVVPLDMRTLVETVYRELIPEPVRQQFKFVLAPIPEACADPLMMRQVWSNLISNAVKFSMTAPVKEIEVGGYTDCDELTYFIKDAGVGFNQAYVDKLFGVFQRLHKAEEYEGSGVGLALVQRIVRRHEGRVWAVGQENAGATFSFSLPVRSPLQ
jgi:light-regulated signal transduction histidine kinase (bacteriophytochrome)